MLDHPLPLFYLIKFRHDKIKVYIKYFPMRHKIELQILIKCSVQILVH